MGTRADFYVGRGKEAEWLGSIALDGYPSGLPNELLEVATEEAFRSEVAAFSQMREDWTSPEQGWPWPWEDSRTTDYAYAFDGDQLYVSMFGRSWRAAVDVTGDEEWSDTKDTVFPKFGGKQQEVAWDQRSGLIIIRG